MARADTIMAHIFAYYGLDPELVTQGSPRKDAMRIKEARRVAAYLLFHDYHYAAEYIAGKLSYVSRNCAWRAARDVPSQLERDSVLSRYLDRTITLGEVLEDIRLGQTIADLQPYDPPTPVEKNRERSRRTGYGGIRYSDRRRRHPWRVHLHHEGQMHHVGYYVTEEDARAALDKARQRLLAHDGEGNPYLDPERGEERRIQRDRRAEAKFKSRSRRRNHVSPAQWASRGLTPRRKPA